MRALWDNLRFNKPKNKYSLEHLKYLYSIISKNPIINEQNKVIIIETLRQIAELLIWGDQHNSLFFDYFLEKNLLAYILNILDQKTSKNVKIQLLQTLSILVENIKAQNSLYYLFSNNHVNELIIHRFDFSDEEVLAYYISLLKTLSLKLDRSTIQFFFNAAENDFPLYTEAIKFFNHEEGMIRIAVRTLTLNVYRVEDEAMRKYILNSTAVPYFSNIVWFIRQQCHTLDQMVTTTTHDNRRKLDDFVAEMLDHFYYLHDIFCLGIESMSLVLSEQLLHYLLTPLLVESLGVTAATREKEGQSEDEKKISPVLALFLLAQVFTVFTHKPLINTLAAALIHPDPSTFFALKQLCPVGPPPPLSDLAPKRTHYVSFRRFSSVPNLELLEAVSLKGTQSAPPSPVPAPTHTSSNPVEVTSPRQSTLSEPRPDTKLSHTPSKSSPSLLSLDEPTTQESPPSDIPTIQIEDYSFKEPSPNIPHELPSTPNPDKMDKGRNIHRDALLGFFEDDRTALNALCMLVALIKNEVVDKDLLEIGGLFPYRLTKAKYLLDILTNNTAKPPISAVAHIKEEHHHSRSKSDSHAVARAIKDLGLQNLRNTNLSPIKDSANIENVDSEVANTSMDSNASVELPGSPPKAKHRTHRATSQAKKPLPPTPSESPKHSVSHQHAFTHSLIGRLLNLLVKSNRYRLVTLQLTLSMLKELVCSPDSPPGLTPRQLATFEKAYRGVSDIFERRLSVEIFLELFDVEVKNYKPPNFEFLIKDGALLLPISSTSKSRLDLPRRLPSGETEVTQQAIQQYLVLRELKYTILHKKDDVLPHLKQHIPNITVSPKDQYNIESTAECIVIPFATVVVGTTVLKKRQKRLLVVNKDTLIVLDPTTNAPKPPSQNPQPEEPKIQQPGHNTVSGTVVHAAPLQSINLEIDRNDPLMLQVTSHPTMWKMQMSFEDEKKCSTAYDLLLVARNELRDARIHKIRTLLATSEDKTQVNVNTSTTMGASTDSVDGIDSFMHGVETINKNGKIVPEFTPNQLLMSPEDNYTSTGFASDLDTTDLTDQTERIDLTEEYSDPAVDAEITENALSTEFAPSSQSPLAPEPTIQKESLPEPTNELACESTPSLTEPSPTQITLTEPSTEPMLPTTTELAPSEPTPSESTPSEPTPSESTPSELTPSELTPSEPTPSEPTPPEPTPSELSPSEPAPSEHTPAEPIPESTEPTPTEQIPTEPTHTMSTPTHTESTPTHTESTSTPEEPTTTEPTPTEPTLIELIPTEPEPTPTEPTPTEPTPTELTSADTSINPIVELENSTEPPTEVTPSMPFFTNPPESPPPHSELNFTESSNHLSIESLEQPPSPLSNPESSPSLNGKHADTPNGYANNVHTDEAADIYTNNQKLLHISSHPSNDDTTLNHNSDGEPLDTITLDDTPPSSISNGAFHH